MAWSLNDLQGLPLKYAKIALTSSGDVVPAVSGKSILVMQVSVLGSATGTIKFQSGGTSDLTGDMDNVVASGLAPGFIGGLFHTAAGEKLNLVLSATHANGSLVYVEV